MKCFVSSRHAVRVALHRARPALPWRCNSASDSRGAANAAPTHADGDIPGLRRDVWKQDEQLVQYPSLDKDVHTDVCIVGAGISGITLAYELVRAGRKVVLLEGRVRGAGMTGKTTAHIMQWNDDYYSEVEKLHGKNAAQLVADSHVKAVDKIRDIVTAEKIDCDFRMVNGYLFPHNAMDGLRTLDTELDACRRAGLVDVEKVRLGGGPRVGGITACLRFPHCADFHPLKYINGLAQSVVDLGGQLYEISQVRSAQNEKVMTLDGHTVHARDAVVLTTHSPITRNLAVHARQEAYRTYVVGLAVPRGSVERAQYWDTQDPYHYVRLQEHDAKTDVLIVGGEDHQTGQRPEKYHPAYERLTAWARARWPSAGEELYRWTGQVYEPADLLGLYGPDLLNPASPRHYIITGHSGQGMTGGTIGAMVVSDQILGRNNPWAGVYCPSRVVPPSLSAVQSLAQEAAATARGYADLVLPRRAADLEGAWAPGRVEAELKRGDGMVVQEGVMGPERVALYKDDDGIVHRHSAVCPHLYCLVEWNPMDKTFDCPCHGSQFDCYGRVVCGPAEHNLHKL